MADVVQAVWEFVRAVPSDAGTSDMPCQHHVFNLDNDTTYLRSFLSHTSHGLTLESSAICKRFVAADDGTVTVVWRSLVDDELMPIQKTSLAVKKRGWFVCTPSDDGNATHLKIFMATTVPLAANEWHQYRQLLHSMRVNGRSLPVDVMMEPAAVLEACSRMTTRMLDESVRQVLLQSEVDTSGFE
ncbi:Aste57867_23441 [Aphanomyces stellatus]|uniref:Aste57867_23441 protein n=1 Tax=Aphanomyces stellatus TaxID=120398 RepID=A0A485LMU6_9STRA|nr:hypothetical protein As57867_023370 [Aphanomyces stellatus]VFU00087.1 Aste57867_23441 [Aphanomyces stellatus]